MFKKFLSGISQIADHLAPASKPIKARQLADIEDYSDGLELLHISVGPYNDPILWFSNIPSDRVSVLKNEFPDPKANYERYKAMQKVGSLRNRICHLNREVVNFTEFKDLPGKYNAIQPIRDDYLVLSYSTKDNPGAWIIDKTGTVLERHHFGPCTSALQVTASGEIWIGYADEGYFSDDKLGANLVAAFDTDENLLFSATRDLPAENDLAFECRGLNAAADNEIWFGYDRLVRLVDKKATRYPEPKWRSDQFAVFESKILSGKMLDPLQHLLLFNLEDESMVHFKPVSQSGAPIAFSHSAARGSRFYMADHKALYVLDLCDENQLVD